MNILEREYEALRAQRVGLRQQRDALLKRNCFAPMDAYGADGTNNRIRTVEGMLRGTERRWAELSLLLRKPYPVVPVKLDAPVQRAPRSTAVRYTGPYMTRALTPR
jgi:hypothetical protein